MLWYHHISV